MRQVLSSQEQQQIKRIVVEAGEKIVARTKHLVLGQKNANQGSSVVTQTDIDTENFLREQLGKYFPRVGFYSEETFKTSQNELEKELVWIVDPIDGTLNFSRGIEIFGVSVALFYQQKPVFGVNYFPKLQQLFWAVKGEGAFVNKTHIRVRQPKPNDSLFGACGVGGITPQQHKKYIDILYHLKFDDACMYSTIYHYAYTAAGHYDFALSIKPALWDIATGWILTEEAGGVFKTLYIDEKRKQANNPYHLWCIGGSKGVVDIITPEIMKLTKL